MLVDVTSPREPARPPEAESGLESGRTEAPALPLSARVKVGAAEARAPTEPPRSRRVTAEDTEEAIRAAMRFADGALGLGNPQEGVVARAVQQAGRASGVPNRTKFSITVTLDRRGVVTDATIRGDVAGARVWPETLAEVRRSLSAAPVPLGPDERGRGVVVRVDATLLHAFASGSDQAVRAGECVMMPRTGGELPAPFVNLGGELHGYLPNGTCVLGDAADAFAPKTIVVRTKTTSSRVGDAPLPASAYPMPPRRRRIPGLQELVARLIGVAR
jgi:hypothetical protein